MRIDKTRLAVLPSRNVNMTTVRTALCKKQRTRRIKKPGVIPLPFKLSRYAFIPKAINAVIRGMIIRNSVKKLKHSFFS